MNLITIFPCIISGDMGIKFTIVIWLVTFVLSAMNLFLSRSKLQFDAFSSLFSWDMHKWTTIFSQFS